MSPTPDTFPTNGTNGITNSFNTNNIPIATTVTFYKHQNWLTDKKQYIIRAILTAALLLIILGIFMIFGRHKENLPARLSERENTQNGSNKYSSISPLQQSGHSEQTSDKTSFDVFFIANNFSFLVFLFRNLEEFYNFKFLI